MNIKINLDLVDERMSVEEKASFYNAIAKYFTISEDIIPFELYDRIDNNISDDYKVELILTNQNRLIRIYYTIYISNMWYKYHSSVIQ